MKKFNLIRKIVTFTLVIAMAVSANCMPAFAAEEQPETVILTQNISIPNDATFIDSSLFTMSNINQWKDVYIYVPNWVSVLYIQMEVYDAAYQDSFYKWEIKKPNGNWEALDDMCPGDGDSCIDRVFITRPGTYGFRVKLNYGSNNSNVQAYVALWGK